MPKLSEARWYLYRSAPKIEMLYEQMFESSTASKKSITIPTPIGSISAESNKETPGVEAKLKRIETELRETGLIGTLSEPGEYVEGLMPMRWGLFDDADWRPKDQAPLVFFGGFDDSEPLIVGLGGSTANIVGHRGATSTHSRSNAHAMTRWLVAGVRDGLAPELPGWWDMDHERDQLFDGIAIALHYLRPPTQNLRFLAKTMETGVHESDTLDHFAGVKKARMILGTPLWVSTAPPYIDDGADRRWGLDNEWKVVEKQKTENDDD